MNYCAIGPIAARQTFEHCTHHMALAQYLYDPYYLGFFQEMVYEGKKVLLDSGVYEGARVPNRELLHWINTLHPWGVILPDEPHSLLGTLKRSIEFSDLIISKFGLGAPKLLKVIHARSGKSDEFIQSYLYDSRLFDGVCFSRLTEDFGYGMTRAEFISMLKTNGFWYPKTYHHALGMIDGSVEEFRKLGELGVDSCDSSAPIWRPLNGRILLNTPDKFHIDFDPFWEGAITHSLDDKITASLFRVGVEVPTEAFIDTTGEDTPF